VTGAPATILRTVMVLLGRAADLGWVGVDLFFVLSGFLITGILLETRDGPNYFRTFYIRRTLRIFPLYFGFLTILFLFPALVLPGVPEARIQLSDRAFWYWTYLVNLVIAADGWQAVPLPVGHLWSLAIEEQFYVVWPLVVFALRPPALRQVCIAIMVGSLVLRCAAVSAGVRPPTVYVFTLTRMDALAAGALVALIFRERRRRISGVQLLGANGAALAALIALTYTRDWLSSEGAGMNTIGFTALAILFGAWVLGARTASPTTRAGSFLHSSILRFFGRYSYALYVFHVPVISTLVWLGLDARLLPSIAGSWLPGKLFVVATATAVSVVLAKLSWELVEKQFMALKDRFAYEHPLQIPAAVNHLSNQP
jgi:peptidoglycan/LPS O-acetylase OafA/YrhL